jgi:cysteinyl-tRNA synthetase
VCGTGQPFVRHWMHVEHLLIENETMSKSKGNVFTIPELAERGHPPDAVRYLLCQGHYRKKLNFTWDGLHQAATSLEKVRSFARRLGEVDKEGDDGPARAAAEKARAEFDRALGDDLNTPEALAAVHGLVNEGNALLASGGLTRAGAGVLRSTLEAMDSVLGVFAPSAEDRLSPEEQALLDERQEARRRREFARADEVRARLEQLGVILEDTAKGTRWRRKR